MTRINVIPPSELCDQHLLAEFRELTRIPNGVLSGKLKTYYPDRPLVYTLGAGHVKFFTNKLYWLHIRYAALLNECGNRGFNVIDIWPLEVFEGFDRAYIPTEQDRTLNRQRIKERWPAKARYYGVPTDCPYL